MFEAKFIDSDPGLLIEHFPQAKDLSVGADLLQHPLQVAALDAILPVPWNTQGNSKKSNKKNYNGSPPDEPRHPEHLRHQLPYRIRYVYGGLREIHQRYYQVMWRDGEIPDSHFRAAESWVAASTCRPPGMVVPGGDVRARRLTTRLCRQHLVCPWCRWRRLVNSRYATCTPGTGPVHEIHAAVEAGYHLSNIKFFVASESWDVAQAFREDFRNRMRHVLPHCHGWWGMLEPDMDAIRERTDNAGVEQPVQPGYSFRVVMAGIDPLEVTDGWRVFHDRWKAEGTVRLKKWGCVRKTSPLVSAIESFAQPNRWLCHGKVFLNSLRDYANMLPVGRIRSVTSMVKPEIQAYVSGPERLDIFSSENEKRHQANYDLVAA